MAQRRKNVTHWGTRERERPRNILCDATRSWLGPLSSFDWSCFQRSNTENKPLLWGSPYFHLSFSEHLPHTCHTLHDARGVLTTQVLWRDRQGGFSPCRAEGTSSRFTYVSMPCPPGGSHTCSRQTQDTHEEMLVF